MAGNGKRLTKDERIKLFDLLTTRHRTSLTDNDIAERMGISRATVAKYKGMFVRENPDLAPILLGVGAPAPVQAAEIAQSADPVAVASALMAAAGPAVTLTPDGASGMTIQALLTALTDLVTSGAPAFRVPAIKLLTELQDRYRPEAHLGPPPPLNDADRTVRLARLIDCCSDQVVLDALARVKPHLRPEPVDVSS